MTNLAILSILLPLAFVGRVIGADSFTSSGYPLTAHVSAADPDAHVWNDTVWVYCSQDANLREYGFEANDAWTYAHMDGYRAFSSVDMINWIDHGEVFHSRNVAWGPPGWMWAPSVAWNGKRGRASKYYLYYAHKDTAGVMRLGVATAASPIGPFVDSGKPIDGVAGMDPHVFIDDDNQAYLYFNSAMVVKLKRNMVELAETPRSIDYGYRPTSPTDKSRFKEGSYMHKRDGLYYYSYSNGGNIGMGVTAYYAMGKSPYGPFKWRGALAGRKSGAQDHRSVISFKNRWYYFFHKDTTMLDKLKMQWYGHRRVACYTEMFYFKNRTILQVNPTTYTINAGGPSYTARDGTIYISDEWWRSGSNANITGAVSDTKDDALFHTFRFDDGAFAYFLPVTNGLYRVTLQYAELIYNSVGKRKFHVFMEGNQTVANLDLVAKAGKKPFNTTHEVVVTDNELNIVFYAVTGDAMVSALKVELIRPATGTK